MARQFYKGALDEGRPQQVFDLGTRDTDHQADINQWLERGAQGPGDIGMFLGGLHGFS
jgi:hypothetical protein